MLILFNYSSIMSDDPNDIFYTISAVTNTHRDAPRLTDGFTEFYNLLPAGVHNAIQNDMFIFDAHWNHRSPGLMSWEGRQTSGILGLPYRAGKFKTLGGEIMPHYSDGAALLEMAARTIVKVREDLEKYENGELPGEEEDMRTFMYCAEPIVEIFQQGTGYINMPEEKMQLGSYAQVALTTVSLIVGEEKHQQRVDLFIENIRRIIELQFNTLVNKEISES